MQRTIAFFRQGSIRKRFFLACVTVLPLFLGLLGTLLDNIHQQNLDSFRTRFVAVARPHIDCREAEPELTDMSINGERRVQIRMPEQLIDPDLTITTSDIRDSFLEGRHTSLAVPFRLDSRPLRAATQFPRKHLAIRFYGSITQTVLIPAFSSPLCAPSLKWRPRGQSYLRDSEKSQSFARKCRAYRSSLALSLSLIGILWQAAYS